MRLQIGTGRQAGLLLALNWLVFAMTMVTLEPGITLTTCFLLMLQLGLIVLHFGVCVVATIRKNLSIAYLFLNGFLNPITLASFFFLAVLTFPGLRSSMTYHGVDKYRETALMLDQTVAMLNILDVGDLPRKTDSLLAKMLDSGVDLNSCELTDRGIKDSWGNLIQMTFDPSVMNWTFRSLGADGGVTPEDDIVKASRAR